MSTKQTSSMYSLASKNTKFKLAISSAFIFMISTMIVNGGNYLYNIVLAKELGPEAFSQAGLLINLLLVFSFLAMTFQIVAAKYSVAFEGLTKKQFIVWFRKISVLSGLVLLTIISMFQRPLSVFFHLENMGALPMLSIALPFFFLMSVERGFLQGKQHFVPLSTSYQSEVWSRLILTFLLFYLAPSIQVEMAVALAILGSIIFGYYPVKTTVQWWSNSRLSYGTKRKIWTFFILTASYECSQIVINYSDVILVKHFFTSRESGWFTSVALMGKVIYFLTWMLAMVLVPKVLNARKERKPYKHIMVKYAFLISIFVLLLTGILYLFPKEIILVLFDQSYLDIAGLLWMYAVATGLFSLSNLFVYFFLTVGKEKLVFLAILFGIGQLIGYLYFHESMAQLIRVQIVAMSILLFSLTAIFLRMKEED